ncbi:MAG TPA: DNA polymerase I [Anaerolineales bacterium]|nr:DNA polymerase I [Anaerolineales bacterium]
MPQTLYLIDGHALAYRTYFALTAGGGRASSWTTSSGEPTAGTYGFASVLLRYLEQDRPDYLMVAFDVGATFRDQLFPEYKATREKMPDDLRIQIDRIRMVVDAFNIPRIERDGYEADDVIGSIARKAAAEGLGVKIITGDRDLLQLVDDRILVSLPEGRSLAESRDYSAGDVIEKLGVRPDQVVDYKALMGDKSDNIPGVAGIGEKTAARLLQDYDTLEGIYAHLDEIGGAVAKKLEAGRAAADLSRELARIITDLDIDLELDRARIDNFDPAPVLDLFHELEFRTLAERLQNMVRSFAGSEGGSAGQGAPAPAPAQPPAAGSGQMAMFAAPVDGEAAAGASPTSAIEVTIVDDAEKLAALTAALRSAEVISFDTETTGTDQMRADLVGISLSIEPGHGYYLPVGHKTGNQLPREDVLDALRPALTDPKIPKIAHNLKYDFIVLARYGLRVHPVSFDTMIAEWLKEPSSRNLGLKRLAWVKLKMEMTEIKDLIGTGQKQITMADVAIGKAAAYAADDAEVVVRLWPILEREVESAGAGGLLREIELPLIEVLAEMEMAGIGLDTGYLAEMSVELGAQIESLEVRVHAAVGESFNLNSTQQLSDALFNRLKIAPPPGTRKTASGHYSTAAEVLEALQDKDEVVGWILNYRELTKLRSTYIDALPAQVNPRTRRVHTSYNQAGSVTGRIASSDPNLQNIPIRTELGRRIRKAFVADPGNRLLSVDYSQVELRVVAHMSDDGALIAAFRAGQDIHATTAAAIYGIPLEQVDRNQRRHAKAINFGLIYGMSAFGLTRTTDLTLAESEDFVETYFKQFPGVKAYLDGMRRLATEQGYVETLLGRRRFFPGLQSGTNAVTRAREEREAINAPIQGTAADILKIAMLRIPVRLRQAGLSARMLLQVHDELVFESPEEEVEDAAAVVRETMSGAYSLKVPLLTEAKSGPNWYDMEQLV